MRFCVGSFFFRKMLEIIHLKGYNISIIQKGNATMKKKKIIIAVVIILAVVLADVFWLGHVPALKENVQKRSSFDTNRMYIVSQMPNLDDPLQSTQARVGIDAYWQANHKYGNAIEAGLQVTKDGEVVVLSGDLSKSDAQILYGKNNASVDALTLEQLQNVNLLYNVKDEDGEYAYRDISDLAKPSVSVLSLSEYLAYFNDGDKINALHILRFDDESKVSGWTEVLDKVYLAVSENDMLSNTVLYINNSGGLRYMDEVHSTLLRAASDSEVRSLKFSSKLGVEKKDLPYVLVYDDYRSIGSEKFVHYAKNCGLAVIVHDSTPAQNGITIPSEDVVREYKEYGVNAIATHSPQTTADLLVNVLKAEKEARTNAD